MYQDFRILLSQCYAQMKISFPGLIFAQYKSINIIIIILLGLDTRAYSPHSFRHGGASFAFAMFLQILSSLKAIGAAMCNKFIQRCRQHKNTERLILCLPKFINQRFIDISLILFTIPAISVVEVYLIYSHSTTDHLSFWVWVFELPVYCQIIVNLYLSFTACG